MWPPTPLREFRLSQNGARQSTERKVPSCCHDIVICKIRILNREMRDGAKTGTAPVRSVAEAGIRESRSASGDDLKGKAASARQWSQKSPAFIRGSFSDLACVASLRVQAGRSDCAQLPQ
jgi:hypothetical protein